MDRIICDICGCEYEQTAERCPICGYPRQGSEKNAVAAGAAERTKVKGGRYSSKNVKKRKKAERKAAIAELKTVTGGVANYMTITDPALLQKIYNYYKEN